MTRNDGAYIRRLRTDRCYSYEALAELLGVHPITVRLWEKKRILKPLVVKAVEQVCPALHVVEM